MKTAIVLLLSLSCASVFADGSTETEWKSTLPMDDYYNELDYVYLNALPGVDGGYCIVTQDEDGNILDLVSTEGALSRKQISKAVRYTTHKKHALMATPFVIGGAFPFVGLAPALGVASAVQLAFMAYFLEIGKTEEDSTHGTTISAATIFPINHAVEEYGIRKSRTNHLTDTDRVLTFEKREQASFLGIKLYGHHKHFGLKKLDLMALRVQEQTPEFLQGCDHI